MRAVYGYALPGGPSAETPPVADHPRIGEVVVHVAVEYLVPTACMWHLDRIMDVTRFK
jgi:hypothetical protein